MAKYVFKCEVCGRLMERRISPDASGGNYPRCSRCGGIPVHPPTPPRKDK